MSNDDGQYFNFIHQATPMIGRPVKKRRSIKTNKGWVIADPEDGDWEFVNIKTGIHHVLNREQVGDMYIPADDEAEDALK